MTTVTMSTESRQASMNACKVGLALEKGNHNDWSVLQRQSGSIIISLITLDMLNILLMSHESMPNPAQIAQIQLLALLQNLQLQIVLAYSFLSNISTNVASTTVTLMCL